MASRKILYESSRVDARGSIGSTVDSNALNGDSALVLTIKRHSISKERGSPSSGFRVARRVTGANTCRGRSCDFTVIARYSTMS